MITKKEKEIQFHHNIAKAVLQMRLHLHKESLKKQTCTLCSQDGSSALPNPSELYLNLVSHMSH